MTKVKLSLTSQNRRGKFKSYYFLILGLFYMVFGILSSIFQEDSSFGLSHLIFGFITIVFFIFQYFHEENYYLLLDENQILYKKSIFTEEKFELSAIKEIQLKVTSLIIKDKNAKSITISFGNLGFTDVQNLKEEIKEYCKTKNIPLKQ